MKKLEVEGPKHCLVVNEVERVEVVPCFYKSIKVKYRIEGRKIDRTFRTPKPTTVTLRNSIDDILMQQRYER